MPIIFAQALMFVPTYVAGIFAEKSDFAANIQNAFASYTSWQYNLLFALLIHRLYLLLYSYLGQSSTDCGRYEA
jgi:preprotein translocase subunit SecY